MLEKWALLNWFLHKAYFLVSHWLISTTWLSYSLSPLSSSNPISSLTSQIWLAFCHLMVDASISYCRTRSNSPITTRRILCFTRSSMRNIMINVPRLRLRWILRWQGTRLVRPIWLFSTSRRIRTHMYFSSYSKTTSLRWLKRALRWLIY